MMPAHRAFKSHGLHDMTCRTSDVQTGVSTWRCRN
ncbi:unnamed protein product [Ectocarpus sp. 8 AP-2014]